MLFPHIVALSRSNEIPVPTANPTAAPTIVPTGGTHQEKANPVTYAAVDELTKLLKHTIPIFSKKSNVDFDKLPIKLLV